MSRRSDQKKARRKKRQTGRDQVRVSEDMNERVAEIIADLEDFDAKLDARGWVSSAEAEAGAVIWFWPPSFAELDDSELATATVLALIEAEGGEIAHVVFVGSDDDHQFNLEELFEHIDTIEAYRLGDALPEFG